MLPHNLLNSQEYIELSHNAKVLLVDVAAQYNGKNNGDLSAEYSKMKRRGWKSKSPLFNARQELVEKGFLVVTAKYAEMSKKPTCFAITWKPIDPTNNTVLKAPSKVASNLWKKS